MEILPCLNGFVDDARPRYDKTSQKRAFKKPIASIEVTNVDGH